MRRAGAGGGRRPPARPGQARVRGCLQRAPEPEALPARAAGRAAPPAAPPAAPQKRMRLAALPPVLCLHLKRFKYIESLGRWVGCRVLRCAGDPRAPRRTSDPVGGGLARLETEMETLNK